MSDPLATDQATSPEVQKAIDALHGRARKLRDFFLLITEHWIAEAKKPGISTVLRIRAETNRKDAEELFHSASDMTFSPSKRTPEQVEKRYHLLKDFYLPALDDLEETARALDPDFDKLTLQDFKPGYLPPNL